MILFKVPDDLHDFFFPPETLLSWFMKLTSLSGSLFSRLGPSAVSSVCRGVVEPDDAFRKHDLIDHVSYVGPVLIPLIRFLLLLDENQPLIERDTDVIWPLYSIVPALHLCLWRWITESLACIRVAHTSKSAVGKGRAVRFVGVLINHLFLLSSG